MSNRLMLLIAASVATVALLSAGGSALSPCATEGVQDGPPREMGEFGRVAPQVGDIRLPDTLVHQDTHGGNLQALQALASSADGFAAVWRDHRDGMMGLYLRLLGPDGAGRTVERPIHSAHSGRRRDPAVALARDGSGAVAWTSVYKAKNTVFLRTFDSRGEYTNADLELEAPKDARPAAGGSSVREGGDRQPSLAWTGDGQIAVLWDHNGDLVGQEFSATGTPRAAARVLGSAPKQGRALLCPTKSSAWVLWNDDEGALVAARVRAGAATRTAKSTRVLAAVPALEGAPWLLIEADGGPRFARLDEKGECTARSPHTIALAGSVLGIAQSGAALGVLVASGESAPAAGRRAREASAPAPGGFALHFFDLHGAPLATAPVTSSALGAEHAQDARLASHANGWLVAWTEDRSGETDVQARLVSSGKLPSEAGLGQLVRVNSDEASSDQSHVRVAAAGDRALVVWQDARDVYERIFARRVAGDALDGDEFELPRPAAGDSLDRRTRRVCQFPEVRLLPDGTFAAVWRELGEGRDALRFQIVRADATAAAPAIDVDPGQSTTGSMPAALHELADAQGFAVAWSRSGGTVWARAFDLEGRPRGEPARVAEDAERETLNPALALLDDGRLVCAWDVQSRSRPIEVHLRLRFLDARAQPIGEVIAPEPSLFGQDWDPSVSAGPRGGFVMAWTAGAPNDLGRDVFARAFDARGRPDGPFLPLSAITNEQDWSSIARLADGSWAVAWEDDLSGHDHAYVRRILPSRRDLGPVGCLNELETRAVPDRVLPAIAAYRGGLIAAWGDRRRSKGWDVYVRCVGPRFDAKPGR